MGELEDTARPLLTYTKQQLGALLEREGIEVRGRDGGFEGAPGLAEGLQQVHSTGLCCGSGTLPSSNLGPCRAWPRFCFNLLPLPLPGPARSRCALWSAA